MKGEYMISLDDIGKKSKEMSAYISNLTSIQKNEILLFCASSIDDNIDYLLKENEKDVSLIKHDRSAFKDRLILTNDRVYNLSNCLRNIANQDDILDEILYMKKLKNGLLIGEKRVPLGVIAIIYESRPNVTVDSFGLCLKSGNASILRGSSEAINSNIALINVLQNAIYSLGHPKEIVQLVSDTSREVAKELMRLNKYVDVLIPRGSAGLIQTTMQNSTVPVIETGAGNCHMFIDETANLQNALKVVINSKVSRPSVCNSLEKLLVHKSLKHTFLKDICKRLGEEGVVIKGDNTVCEVYESAFIATDADWEEEYLDMIIAVKVVDDINDAIEHIKKYSTRHSEAIITESYTNANKFTNEVDAAAVYVNASTRFTDGEEFGLGAEIGISTQKLHVRGPMGLKALTSTKFIILGNGQIR